MNTGLEVHLAVKLTMEEMRCKFTHWQIQQVGVTHVFLSSYNYGCLTNNLTNMNDKTKFYTLVPVSGLHI